jgi:hypothetical protein
MKFLPDWLTRWTLSRAEEASDPAHLPVVRFIASRSQRWKEGGFRLKPGAFLPAAGATGGLELSVFRTDGLTEAAIWSLAHQHVVPVGRNVHGRADLRRFEIETTSPPLRLVMDETPTRHGNVVDWPDEHDERLALAQELASRARHVEPPAEPKMNPDNSRPRQR